MNRIIQISYDLSSDGDSEYEDVLNAIGELAEGDFCQLQESVYLIYTDWTVQECGFYLSQYTNNRDKLSILDVSHSFLNGYFAIAANNEAVTWIRDARKRLATSRNYVLVATGKLTTVME